MLSIHNLADTGKNIADHFATWSNNIFLTKTPFLIFSFQTVFSVYKKNYWLKVIIWPSNIYMNKPKIDKRFDPSSHYKYFTFENVTYIFWCLWSEYRAKFSNQKLPLKCSICSKHMRWRPQTPIFWMKMLCVNRLNLRRLLWWISNYVDFGKWPKNVSYYLNGP